MTTYTAFGVNGNGADGPSSSLALGSSWAAGTLFKVTESGYQLSGYGQWITNDGSMTTDLTFALWEDTGTVVADSTATITTLTPGTWQYVELATPIVLTAGMTYKAVVCSGSSGCLPWQANMFDGPAGTYVNGVTNGPLTIFSSDADDQGTNPDPFNDAQCTFNESQSDPTAANPVGAYQASNCWVDVQITPVGIQYNTGTTGGPSSSVNDTSFTIPDTGGLEGTGVLVGDVMLLHVVMSTDVATPPSLSFAGGGGDWELIPMTDGSANPQSTGYGGGFYNFAWAYQRVAASADIGATVTITESGGSPTSTYWETILLSYTGANQYNPVDRAGGANNAVTGTTVDLPSETARIAGDWAVYFAGLLTESLSTPSGATLRQQVANGEYALAAAWDSSGAIGLTSAGGGTLTGTATPAGSGTPALTAFTICLAPAGIYVVQTQDGNSGSPTFDAEVAEHNTVVLIPIMYDAADVTSSNVKLGGSTVTGTTLFQHVTDTSICSHDIWILPDCPAGQTAVTFDVDGALDSVFLYEIAGLGPNPTADQIVSAHRSFSDSAAIIGAGPTSPTVYENEIAIAASAAYNGGVDTEPDVWISPPRSDSDHGWSGYQVFSSSGATPSFAFINNEAWTAGIVTIAPGSGGGGATVAGQVANVTVAALPGTESITLPGPVAAVAVAAPVGHANVSAVGAAAGVLVAAVPGLASVSVAGPSVSVLVAALAGTASSSSPAIVNGQAANVAVVAWLGQARGVSRAKGGLFLVHFP